MIHENVDISGSLDVSGSFIIPNGPSSSTPSNPDTGSLFFNTTDSTLYEWVGSWSIVGTQVTPQTPSADIEYLVVAGGGGGGADSGGGPGGGAGGYLSSSLSSVESGSTFTVTVGAGGTAMASNVPAGDGGDSSIAGASISTVTSIGGGGAGSFYETPDSLDYYGHDGGSGGGSGNGNGSYTRPNGGSGTVGQGNNGGGAYPAGVNNNNNSGGGGGGAGAAGTSGTSGVGGNGGDGKQSSITGTATYYAGGGGATCRGDLTEGTGGQGGGGNGGYLYGQNGTANTGGGAGGSRSTPAAVGGSGVVILAYNSGSINGAGGIVGDAGNGRKYHQFNQSGTFKAGSTSDFSIVTDSLGIHLDAGNFASRGASTWTDLSGNGRNGTLSGPTLGNNTYYTFDGSNDYIYIDQFDHTSTNSVEMWYKKNSYVQYATPYAWGYTPTQRWQFLNADQNMYVYFLGSGGTSVYEDTGIDVTTSEGWVHIVVTADYTADEYKVYKNGSLITTADLGGQSWSYTGASNAYDYIDIGKNVNNNNGYINSDVGQFRIYTKVLTASEVLQNYNSTKTNFI